MVVSDYSVANSRPFFTKKLFFSFPAKEICSVAPVVEIFIFKAVLSFVDSVKEQLFDFSLDDLSDFRRQIIRYFTG